MSSWRKTLLLLFGLVVAAALPSTARSEPVQFQTIDKGDISYYLYGEPEFNGAFIVIRDRKTWGWFWKVHKSGLQPLPALPPVNFKAEMVLAAILGHQSSGGGPAIEIDAVEELLSLPAKQGKAFRVLVKENLDPGMLTVITNPYHIIKLEKGHSVVFERGYFESARK